MFRVKAIMPDADRMEKEIWRAIEEQAQEAYQREVSNALREVTCREHGQHARVKLDPVRLSTRPSSITYRVLAPCCTQLVDAIKRVLGERIPVRYE